MKKLCNRFLGQHEGATAVIFAMAAPVFLGISALAIDFSAYSKYQGRLQMAADTAVLSAAKELTLANADKTAIRAIAINYVRSNAGIIAKGAKVELKINAKDGSVAVRITKPWSPFFAQYFSKAITPVVVTATARVRSTGKICVIGLSKTGRAVVHMDDRAHLLAEKCGVYSNSENPKGLKIDDAGQLTAEFVCSAGGVKSHVSAEVFPVPVVDCPAVKDPLAERVAPTVGRCNHKNMEIRNTDTTLYPGVYCNGLNIQGNSKVALQPGIYIIKKGEFIVSDTATLDGTNVAFYLTKDATFKFNKQSTINLSAPKDGSLAGILFFESRKNSLDLTHKITSDNARMLLGTIYLSRGSLVVDAGAPVADKSAYTAIIVNSLKLKEGPVLHLNANYTATNIPVPTSLIGGDIILDR